MCHYVLSLLSPPQPQPQPPPQPPPPRYIMAHPVLPQDADAIVLPLVSGTSGGDDDDDDDDDYDDDKSDNGEEALILPDELYGHALDDQDEAWVYQNLRSGMVEPTRVIMKDRQCNNNNNNNNNVMMQQQQQQQQQQQHALIMLMKPRTSDAVLSCPCCFTICCMDCQQHERYATQFRAMFVMNITVDWTRPLAYSDKDQQLVEYNNNNNNNNNNNTSTSGGSSSTTTTTKTTTTTSTILGQEQELYYSVHCANCNTQVAALDNNEEVYHFFGCLVSA